MPTFVYGDTTVEISNTGGIPEWSEGVLEAFRAIQEALSGVVSTGDIPKQSFTLTNSHNPGTDVTIPGMSFSTSIVRGGFVEYTVYRETSSTSSDEVGVLEVVYNADNATDSKWEIQREYVGDAGITFSITDAGQFMFSTDTMAGTGHSGLISFVGTALLQS